MLCRAIIFNLAALLLLQATAFACPDIDGLVDVNCDQKLTIITFGDSITKGVGDSLGIGYPGRLQQALPHALIYNFGVPGEKTPTGKVRAPMDFATVLNPDFIILLEGVNDYYLTDRTYTATKNNLQSMCFSGGNTAAITLLGKLTYTSRTDQLEWVKGVNNAIVSISKTSFPRVDFFSLGKPIVGGDRLHPNAEGYQQMANLAQTIMIQQGNARRPVDTDGDGVYDFAERRARIEPGVTAEHPNPLDYDNDGLSDFEEIVIYHSNPGSPDGDGDGLSDYYEVKTLGSNPADPRPGAPQLTNLEIIPE